MGADAGSINPLYVLDASAFSDAFLAMTVAAILALVAALGLSSGRQDDAAKPSEIGASRRGFRRDERSS